MVDIVVTGLSANSVPYIEALERQRALHADVVAGRAQDTVILLEHPSVYTAGRRTEPTDRPRDGTPVVDVDRGGRITWHGPGQLVGYPIVRLPEPLDVVAHVRRLEDALLGLLAELGVDARRVDGRSGVWVRGAAPDGTPRDEKVAAIGVRVAERVTLHGFALNCSNSLDAYDRIVPCGIRDAGVTTISRILGRTVTPAAVVPLLRPHLMRALAPNGSAMTPTAPLSPVAGARA
ncbi:lipoyl(octanoyl) transferase LipB [Clavibacter sp. CT19]|uniref:lipoyl(octanoyl) transferase LipB n=1 Tax=unclassified Clavibacter TaxID=2626594 RepID=UPI0022EA3B00|nr:lipoyl(octanoyl) transferase LipB [Clavibacter sp. CT19]MDA3803521.1 lipoyl(octanoyl) transferase LipB [Clavibacter sp. CT19]